MHPADFAAGQAHPRFMLEYTQVAGREAFLLQHARQFLGQELAMQHPGVLQDLLRLDAVEVLDPGADIEEARVPLGS